MNKLKKLIVEIHQRSLWQALVVYFGASYAVLEAVALPVVRTVTSAVLRPGAAHADGRTDGA